MRNAQTLINRLSEKKLKLATAESCTGGLIAATITAIPGSSKVFERGFITYSNESKTEMLGVAKLLMEQHGSVSAAVAGEMARGALTKSAADISIAVTGIAGPGGGTAEKPVGLVYIAVCYQGNIRVTENHFSGNRAQIQTETVARAFDLIESVVN